MWIEVGVSMWIEVGVSMWIEVCVSMWIEVGVSAERAVQIDTKEVECHVHVQICRSMLSTYYKHASAYTFI